MKATIPHVSKKMQSILCQTANEVAAKSGLIKRQRKVNGANLAQTLVLMCSSKSKSTPAFSGSHSKMTRFNPQYSKLQEERI